jgi:hypothetical protein
MAEEKYEYRGFHGGKYDPDTWRVKLYGRRDEYDIIAEGTGPGSPQAVSDPPAGEKRLTSGHRI